MASGIFDIVSDAFIDISFNSFSASSPAKPAK